MSDTIEDIRARHQIDVKWCGWWSHDRKQQHDDRATLLAEVDRLRAMLPPTAHSGVRNGPGEGSWSVFAEKVVEERDAAKAEVERITRQRDAWATEANRLREELRWYTDPRNSDSGTRARLALWGKP